MNRTLIALMTTVLSAYNRGSGGYTQTGGDENDFLPPNRGLGECISSLPKPGCGSEAQGGWRQGLILIILLLGLAFIAWRIWMSSRKARIETK